MKIKEFFNAVGLIIATPFIFVSVLLFNILLDVASIAKATKNITKSQNKEN